MLIYQTNNNNNNNKSFTVLSIKLFFCFRIAFILNIYIYQRNKDIERAL